MWLIGFTKCKEKFGCGTHLNSADLDKFLFSPRFRVINTIRTILREDDSFWDYDSLLETVHAFVKKAVAVYPPARILLDTIESIVRIRLLVSANIDLYVPYRRKAPRGRFYVGSLLCGCNHHLRRP